MASAPARRMATVPLTANGVLNAYMTPKAPLGGR